MQVNRDFDLLFLGIMAVGAALIARRNLRLGRSDRRGAMRLAVFVFVCSMLTWAFLTSHVASDSELALLLLGASLALFLAGVCWLMYVALEPLIRRRWPDSLIAWTRLLSGRFSDPLVGRVLLAGALLGVFAAIAGEALVLARRAIEATPPIPPFPWDPTLRGPRAVASHLLQPRDRHVLRARHRDALLSAARGPQEGVARGCRLRADLDRACVSSPVARFRGLSASSCPPPSSSSSCASACSPWVFANYFGHCLEFPLTTDSSAWYAGTSLFVLLVLAAIAIYGFRIALAGRPMFSGAGLDD